MFQRGERRARGHCLFEASSRLHHGPYPAYSPHHGGADGAWPRAENASCLRRKGSHADLIYLCCQQPTGAVYSRKTEQWVYKRPARDLFPHEPSSNPTCPTHFEIEGRPAHRDCSCPRPFTGTAWIHRDSEGGRALNLNRCGCEQHEDQRGFCTCSGAARVHPEGHPVMENIHYYKPTPADGPGEAGTNTGAGKRPMSGSVPGG